MSEQVNRIQLKPCPTVKTIDKVNFAQAYFKPLKPLVIKNLASDWPAQSKWTPDFFRAHHGEKRVTVYDKNFVTPGKGYMNGVKQMRLSEYIDHILHSETDLRLFLYNITTHIPELLSDIVLPDIVDGFSKRFVFMFFGCKGSVTQMHFDIDMSHVFHTTLYGKKTVTLYPYQQGRNLHRTPFTCRTYVDVHAPDFNRFPRLENAHGYRVTLEAGDTLFIPSGYWHHMVYDEAGYALSLRCSNPDLKSKLHGVYNVTIMQSIDRMMNALCPDKWHTWKEKKALDNGR